MNTQAEPKKNNFILTYYPILSYPILSYYPLPPPARHLFRPKERHLHLPNPIKLSPLFEFHMLPLPRASLRNYAKNIRTKK